MRLSTTAGTFFLSFFCLASFAQSTVDVTVMESDLQPQTAIELFQGTELPAELQPTHQAITSKGLELMTEAFELLKQQKPEHFGLDIPFPNGQSKTVHLQQFDVRSDAFEVTVTDQTGHHSVEHESNIVAYQLVNPNESGVLILMEDHVVASFSVNAVAYEINPRSASGLHAIFELADSKSDQTFSCALDEVTELQAPVDEPDAMASMLNPACLEMAIDIDQYTYQQLGFDVQTAVDWALATLSAVDQIYRSELLDNSAGTEIVTLQARVVHVWVAPDPYLSVTNDGSGILAAFRDEWASNPDFTAVPVDLKHLFTLRTNIGTGGIAYLSTLCDGTFNCGVSGNMTGETTFDLASFTWNPYVVAHEIGHNCGANHTHWCGWPGGPIDNCADLEGDCTGYTNNPTNTSSTIMSYCQQTGGTASMTFNTIVEDNALEPTIAAASCIGSCDTQATLSTAIDCNDPAACNYDASSTGDGDCLYPDACYECGPNGTVQPSASGTLSLSTINIAPGPFAGSAFSFTGNGIAASVDVTLTFDNSTSPTSQASDLLMYLQDPAGNQAEWGGNNGSTVTAGRSRRPRSRRGSSARPAR